MTPLLALVYLLEHSGKHFLCLSIYYITKDVIKDADGQPDEEIQRMRSAGVLRVRSSVPMGLAAPSTQLYESIHQPGCSWNPILLGFFWRFHHVCMIE